MEIYEQDIIDKAIEILKPLAKKAADIVSEAEDVLKERVEKEYLPLLDDLKKNLITGETKGIAFGEKVGVLDRATLVEFSKKHLPKDLCNQVVAWRFKDADDYMIYLAYAYDGKLLPHEFNHYVIIQVAILAQDVEVLFEKSDFIILK